MKHYLREEGDICSGCKQLPVGYIGIDPKNGRRKFAGLCYTCRDAKYKKKLRYRKVKKSFCEKCGFEGHKCQLDVDHIDGNHLNNDPSNLQTLCANCHRLKTFNDVRRHILVSNNIPVVTIRDFSKQSAQDT